MNYLVNVIKTYKHINYNIKKMQSHVTASFCCGIDLFSREAALQVSSARTGLTTVFGMGTGGTPS